MIHVNIGSGNGLVPSGNKQLSKPMSTRTEFNIAIYDVTRTHFVA